jgi:hypothetical protein
MVCIEIHHSLETSSQSLSIGPMIGFSIFGERILILNDREDAEELV